MKKESAVDVTVDFGALKPAIERAARAHGVTLNEFICSAVESQVKRNREYESGEKDFTPHGGKHLFGKHTGYEVTKDGKYYPCPSWKDQFSQLFAERSAITNLANAVISQSQERLVEVEKQLDAAKKQLIDDLGLDPEKDWAYYGGTQNYIAEVPEANEK